jgi:hypothetical protein
MRRSRSHALRVRARQDVQPLQRDCLDGEEVDREHALRVLPQERPPRQARTHTDGTDACLEQDLPDGRRRHFQARSVDLASDPLLA